MKLFFISFLIVNKTMSLLQLTFFLVVKRIFLIHIASIRSYDKVAFIIAVITFTIEKKRCSLLSKLYLKQCDKMDRNARVLYIRVLIAWIFTTACESVLQWGGFTSEIEIRSKFIRHVSTLAKESSSGMIRINTTSASNEQ
jgi:hypothetical protein